VRAKEPISARGESANNRRLFSHDLIRPMIFGDNDRCGLAARGSGGGGDGGGGGGGGA